MGKWTRRGFVSAGIVAGGALVVGVAIRPGHRAPKLAKFVTEGEETLLTAWVKIAPDNTVTAIIPHAEMGQGVLTSLGMMLAEELDADWENVQVMEAPAVKECANFFAAREYIAGDLKAPGFVLDTINGAFLKISKSMDLQITGGSLSVRYTGAAGMQVAGAAARELLMKAAAKTWSVPIASLQTRGSHIFHKASGKSAPYADFVIEAARHKPNLQPKLKARKDYSIMGTHRPRIDIPAKVDGTAKFGIDADIEGMKYATVKAAPVLGNTVKSMNAAKARSMSGVIDVLNMGDFVAVIADGYWQAKQALDMVDIEFTRSDADTMEQADVYAQYRRDMDGSAKHKTIHKAGHKAGKVADVQAASVFEAEYTVPFLAHATMEPMNATAWVRDGKCDVWTGTQNPLGTRGVTAKTLGMKFDNVKIHNQFLGGGFGRRAMSDYTDQAVRLSQKTGLPIKLIWSREEDMAQDHYRPSAISRMKAGLDKNGLPISWKNLFVHKHDPVEASLIPYGIGAQNISYVESPTHIRFGPWRSVDHSQHGFFTESFVDELAHNAGQDGYAFRRALLKNQPRHLAVLDAAAKHANFGKTMPAGTGQGISIVHSFDTIVAQVVEVDVRSGAPIVTHVTCAADAGFAVAPDGFKAQMESGIIFGLTAALYGEISIANGAVQQSNFHDYEMIRMDTAPKIDVLIVNSEADIGGAGEPGTPPIAPAFTNAIFAATGKRIRSLPVMNTEFDNIS